MRVLVIGGTRFMGYQLTWRLIAGGHSVTLLNRGTTGDPFGARVTRIRCDRTSPSFVTALSGMSFDACVDFAAYQRADATGVVAALGRRVGHYVMISTGQVYLVKATPGVGPSREEDYEGPVMAAPAVGHRDHADWAYGVGKRECEDVLVSAWRSDRFPSTRVRIPIVNGERDASRRLEGYVWRILDGGPVLLPDGGASLVRQVYSGAVVALLLRVLGDPATFGQAYNFCQQETPTLSDLVGLVADLLGAPQRVVGAPTTQMESAGLDPVAASPFSTRWKSFLDPSRAARELGLVHPPLRVYMEKVLASMLASWREDAPPGYAQRAREVEFVRSLPPPAS